MVSGCFTGLHFWSYSRLQGYTVMGIARILRYPQAFRGNGVEQGSNQMTEK